MTEPLSDSLEQIKVSIQKAEKLRNSLFLRTEAIGKEFQQEIITTCDECIELARIKIKETIELIERLRSVYLLDYLDGKDTSFLSFQASYLIGTVEGNERQMNEIIALQNRLIETMEEIKIFANNFTESAISSR